MPATPAQAAFPALFMALVLSLISSAGDARATDPAAVPPPAVAAPPPPPVSAEARYRTPGAPAIEQVAPGIFRMGEIEIDKKNRSVTFPAQVNQDKGLLEYLLVRTGGKTHESLLRTDLEPYHLQIAFLLLGFEPTAAPLQFQGAPEKPQGSPVEIFIAYTNRDGRSTTVRAEEWVATKVAGIRQDRGKIDWTFTGSVVANGRFLAQLDGSIIATYHDPVAMIDNASPGGESDKIWYVAEETVAPAGTAVRVTVRAVR